MALGKRYKSSDELHGQRERLLDNVSSDLRKARKSGDTDRVKDLETRRNRINSRFKTYIKNMQDEPFNDKHDTDVYTAPRPAPRGWGGYVGGEFADAQMAHTKAREEHRQAYNRSLNAKTATKGNTNT